MGVMYLTYEELLIESESQNLIVKEKNLPGYNGRIYKNRIAISKNLNMSEKKSVLAEELGHHHTSVGNILNMEDLSNRKQERQARLWGYNKLIGLTGIVNAFESGCQSAYEASEFLEVTVEYLQECIDCYRDKYGICTEIDNYIIYFIPNMAVMEKV